MTATPPPSRHAPLGPLGGAELIVAERARQIDGEGYEPLHDDGHKQGELAWAAVCYAAPGQVYVRAERGENTRIITLKDPWPWHKQYDKRGTTDRIRELVKAGALIAAEIDRIQRFNEYYEAQLITQKNIP